SASAMADLRSAPPTLPPVSLARKQLLRRRTRPEAAHPPIQRPAPHRKESSAGTRPETSARPYPDAPSPPPSPPQKSPNKPLLCPSRILNLISILILILILILIFILIVILIEDSPPSLPAPSNST